MRRFARLLLPLLLLCAVSAAAVSARPQAPTLPGYPALGAPPDITLLGPGAAPRRPLRYTVARGATSTLEISQSVTNRVSLGGVSVSLPTTVMVIDLHVTDVAPSGDITFGMTFRDAGVAEASREDPMAPMMAMGLAALKGVAGTGTITSRGIAKSVQVNLDRIVDPAVRAALAQAATIEYLSTPFPEAALGVGAKWEVRETADAGGVTVFKKFEYELVTLDAAGATIAVKTEQSAPRQSGSKPGTPAGEQTTLEKLTGSGVGTTTVRFAALAAATTIDSTTSLVMAMPVDGQRQSVTTDVTAKLRMTVK